ncbi:MAG: tRNA lysidine(34) synthetase TilS [Desulfobacter sp.]|nr:MAG: tRNA lysidine(34) synthetase TilS [Desulfobacter sp.]
MPAEPHTGFIDRVRRTIAGYAMAGQGDKLLIGLSGGPDSVTLARVLLALKDEMGFSLGAAHLNHNLRGEESVRDENFVREFAADAGIDLSVESRDIKAFAKKQKLSLEEAGRNARYDFFSRTAAAGGYTRIATGHNRDDHVELVLMNLIRGTGPTGLRGIPPVREGRFIRPLINMPKADILAFLASVDQPFVMDSSNTDPAFLRNRVRTRLIPLLEAEYNPDIRTGLDRLSGILAQEDDYLETETTQALHSILQEESPERLALSAPELSALHPALAARVLRRGLQKVKQDLRRISHTHIRDIITLCTGEPGKSLDLPGRIRVYKRRGQLCIQKEKLPLRELGRRQKAAGDKTCPPSP